METPTDQLPEEATKDCLVPVGRYVPELDGLRFFAIFGVLLFHGHFPGFQMGWAGVPLFFVLSGYLITGILLRSKDKPHYFRNFYVRRVLRIFPIYYLFILAQIAFGIVGHRPIGDAPYFFLYLQNYLFGFNLWHVKFMGADHTWSLAIEEQFYLVWPLVVYLLSSRRLAILAAGMVFAAICYRFLLWFGMHNPLLIYLSLFSAMDCLAMGALLAVVVQRGITRSCIRRWGLVVSALSGAFVFVPVAINGLDHYISCQVYLKDPFHFFWLTALALFFTGLVALALSGVGLWPRILRMRPLVHVGKISYGIYLYHTVCFSVAAACLNRLPSIGPATILRTAAGLVLTYLVSLASWHVVEKRFLALKDRYTL